MKRGINPPWILLVTLGVITAGTIALAPSEKGHPVDVTKIAMGAGDCWSVVTKIEAQSLAESMVIDRVLKLRHLGPESAASLRPIVHVSLDGFHADGRGVDASSVACGAAIDLSIDKTHGGSYQSHGTVVSFGVHQAESGQVVTIDQADIYRVIMDAANGY